MYKDGNYIILYDGHAVCMTKKIQPAGASPFFKGPRTGESNWGRFFGGAGKAGPGLFGEKRNHCTAVPNKRKSRFHYLNLIPRKNDMLIFLKKVPSHFLRLVEVSGTYCILNSIFGFSLAASSNTLVSEVP